MARAARSGLRRPRSIPLSAMHRGGLSCSCPASAGGPAEEVFAFQVLDSVKTRRLFGPPRQCDSGAGKGHSTAVLGRGAHRPIPVSAAYRSRGLIPSHRGHFGSIARGGAPGFGSEKPNRALKGRNPMTPSRDVGMCPSRVPPLQGGMDWGDLLSQGVALG